MLSPRCRETKIRDPYLKVVRILNKRYEQALHYHTHRLVDNASEDDGKLQGIFQSVPTACRGRWDRTILMRRTPWPSLALYLSLGWRAMPLKFKKVPPCESTTSSWRACPVPHSMRAYIWHWNLRPICLQQRKESGGHTLKLWASSSRPTHRWFIAESDAASSLYA